MSYVIVNKLNAKHFLLYVYYSCEICFLYFNELYYLAYLTSLLKGMKSMSEYKDILVEALSKRKSKISFDNLRTESLNEIVELTCYKTIKRIRKILDNDKLDDFECIERIVKLLEGIGLDGGSRHDFG